MGIIAFKQKTITYPYILLVFLSFLAIPGFLSNIGVAGSHAFGMLLSIIPIALISLVTRDWMPFTKHEFQICLCILCVILIHFLFVVLVGGIDNYISAGALSRFTSSFILLIIVLWAAFQFDRYLSVLEQPKFARMVGTIYWLFILLAILSIPFHILDWVSRKQMLIFSEPSHFAVVFGPFFLFKMIASQHRYKHLFLCFSLCVFLQSLTLVVFAILGIIVSVKRFGILQVMGIITLIGLLTSTIIYFDDFFIFIMNRTTLSANSENLSVLVFLSGYERAYLTFFDSYLLGVGFQQLGVIGPLGEFQIAIMEQTKGYTMNTLDGGSLFSKLTAEFGIFGIFIVFAYIAKAFGVFRISRTLSYSDARELFYRVSFLSGVILIFIRSVNYFSPSCFIFLISLIGLSKFNLLRTRTIKQFSSV